MKLEVAIFFLSDGEKAQSTDQQAKQVSQIVISLFDQGYKII